MVEAAQSFVVRGGPMMVPLICLGLLLWYMITLRTLTLRRATTTSRPLGRIEKRLAELEREAGIGRFRGGIRVIVAVAPLLGLLGTVAGMVQTFQALGGAGSEGLSGGISQALISTQMGLCVAIPGLLMSRVLDQWERRLTRSLL